ncbi:MAG: branched-chain amino acid ABC transporter permease [Chloroflexia bacterium]
MLRQLLRRVTLVDIFMWIIGLFLIAMVVYGSARTLASGKYAPTEWLNLTVTGIALGGIYALVALGYTLVYGILRMINFAHSEVFMSGPFTAYFLADALDKAGYFDRYPILSLFLVMLLSMAVATTVAVLLERIAYRPLRTAPRLVPLITAIGASFFLQYTFRGLFGSGIKGYPETDWFKRKWCIQGTQACISMTQILVIVAAILMMVALYAFVQWTKIGKAMRAVSEDKETAALMGIDVDRVIATTFAVGGALAGVAGVLYALMFRQVQFFMGFVPGIKAFTAAVLGGIGNIPGAMLGGLFLGIFEALGPNLFLDGLGIPAPYQLKDAIAYTMLVLILIFRPTGILGERLARKKA